jgi:PAS domain S-box-containing protein
MESTPGTLQELAQAEERMRSVVNHVVDGIISIDDHGTVTTFNPAAERIFGYAAAEVIGQNVKLLMPEPYHSEHDEYIANYLRTGQAKIIGIGREVVGRRKDGSTFPMELAISVFRLGERRHFTGIVRDITERKRNEAALRNSEERVRLIVESALDAVVTINEQGVVTGWNPQAEAVFGWPRDEAMGRLLADLIIPHEHRAAHARGLQRFRETGDGPILNKRLELSALHRGGWEFPIELTISPIQLGDRVEFSAFVRDITDRKRTEEELRQAEERMRSVVNHVIDGIITIDERGRVESFNPAAEKLFGYARTDVIGQNVKVLMPEPYHGEHDHYIQSYVTTGVAKIIGIGREVVGRRKDGSTFPMELAVSAFHIGPRRYFTGIVRDITERKRLEQELRQRLADLAEADRQKNEFLAMLAHELRNPLAPMRNALHLMRLPGAEVTMVAQARDMMERQMHHLVRLVDDLLDVSRIIRGNIELRKEPVDLAVAVSRAVETAQPVVEAQGHHLAVSLAEQPVWVEGDLIRLSQVIANLLTNAAKYTDKAGRITVKLEREDGEAVVRVRDTGVGIPPDLQPRIFDLFVQGDRTLARSQGGLGIGLTLVKRLVEMHAGTIAVASAGVGQGSEFTVRLPALSDGQGSGAAGVAGERARVTDALRKRVLVVDDNVDAAESIAMILRVSGYDVRCVYDGPSVLPAARAYRPDVVVLDIGLPGLNGYDVARGLREQPEFKRTPLVAVTGYGQEEDRQRSHEAGFDYHLTKPVDPDALQAFVARPFSFR